MSLIIKQIQGVPFQFGGEEHSGWLPPSAARPLPTPVRHLVLNLAIEKVDGGFLLLIESQDGSMNFDDWYDTLEATLTGAEKQFGVQSSQWHDVVRTCGES